MYVTTKRRGFGDVSPQQIVGTAYGAGTGIAAPIAGTALASTLGISASLAIPIVGAAFAGIFLGIQAIMNSGCGQTCIETSDWANQAEPLLQKNVAAYLALPTPRAASAQAAYLKNFDDVWGQLVQLCSQPGTGNAGVRCITDRQRGACKWKNASGCFNWFSAYRDPIANDSNVVPDAQAALSSMTGALGGGNTGTLLLAAALIAVGAFVL